MNKSVLLGRITRDLELTYTANSMAILKFNIAVNRRKKGEADFINCIAFDKTAENINKFFEKGSLIAIIGHIQTGSYDNKEGKKVYTTDVIVDEFDFCGGGKKSDDKPDSYEPATQNNFVPEGAPELDDELPF